MTAIGDTIELDGHRWTVLSVAPGKAMLRRLDRPHIVRIAPDLPAAPAA